MRIRSVSVSPLVCGSYKIDFWYDYSLRVWTIQVKNGNDEQIGEVYYEKLRFHAFNLVDELRTKYRGVQS